MPRATKAEKSKKPKQASIDLLYRRLQQEFGPCPFPLRYKAPHELAIAVILSAQCTDQQVNRVTPALFAAFRSAKDFYQREQEELERFIYSTGFYRNKAANIRRFCRMLVEQFGGKIPNNMRQLISMPGVGRKTANVILQELYGLTEGIVVDTHVARISRLLALSREKSAQNIEKDLMQKIPRRYWMDWPLLIIYLGRSYCTARKRDCRHCPLNDLCPSSSYTPASGHTSVPPAVMPLPR